VDGWTLGNVVVRHRPVCFVAGTQIGRYGPFLRWFQVQIVSWERGNERHYVCRAAGKKRGRTLLVGCLLTDTHRRLVVDFPSPFLPEAAWTLPR